MIPVAFAGPPPDEGARRNRQYTQNKLELADMTGCTSEGANRNFYRTLSARNGHLFRTPLDAT